MDDKELCVKALYMIQKYVVYTKDPNIHVQKAERTVRQHPTTAVGLTYLIFNGQARRDVRTICSQWQSCCDPDTGGRLIDSPRRVN